jgi:hypothetical protein
MKLSPLEQEILFWVLSKDEKWGITFTLNSRLSLNNNIQYLYSCSIESLGKDAIGYGCDVNRRRAQLKAAVEAIERQLVADNNWKHTNGIALNPDPELAKISSMNESYERDAFFCHFITQRPFSLPNNKTAEIDWSKEFKDSTARPILRRAHSHPDIHVIIALITSIEEGVGMVMGMGANADENKAILHAQRECMSIFTFLRNNKPLNYTIKDFYAKTDLALLDHALLGTDPRYAEWFLKIYVDKIVHYKPSTNVVPEITCNRIFGEKYDNCPLFVAKADVHQLQSPYWGRYPEELNVQRLLNFSDGEWIPGTMPELTHCFA